MTWKNVSYVPIQVPAIPINDNDAVSKAYIDYVFEEYHAIPELNETGYVLLSTDDESKAGEWATWTSHILEGDDSLVTSGAVYSHTQALRESLFDSSSGGAGGGGGIGPQPTTGSTILQRDILPVATTQDLGAVIIGDGLSVSANGTVSVNIYPSQWRQFSFTGDGTATQFTITHNLGHYGVIASVTNSAREVALCEIRENSVNSLIVTFAVPPTAGEQFQIAICGSVTSVADAPVRWFHGDFEADGTGRTFTVTHNLGSYGLIASVSNSVHERVLCDLREVSENVLEITFTETPTSGAVYYVAICASVPVA